MSIFSINEHYQLLKIFEVFEKTAIYSWFYIERETSWGGDLFPKIPLPNCSIFEKMIVFFLIT